jgi:hypothetical protein
VCMSVVMLVKHFLQIAFFRKLSKLSNSSALFS